MKVYIMKSATTEKKMISFAISKGFIVWSTTFPLKDNHKETWYSTDGRTAHQIDHVLISNRFRRAIIDISALRGLNIGSDHSLLKINFKVKLSVKTENKYGTRKFVNIFQNSMWKQEYALELNNRFEMLETMEDEDNIDNNNNE